MLDHGLNLALAGALEPVLVVEREAFCVANLAWQMEQGFLPEAHIWHDAKTVTRPRVREIVGARLGGRRLNFIFGGIPCQPHSQAGKRLGKMDERDLWPATLAAVAVYQPRFVFIENVDGIASSEDGARRIICDLEKAGYRTKAGLFSSKECGANHQRKRWFFLGIAESDDQCRVWKREKGVEEPFGRSSGIMGIADNDGRQREDISLSARESGESGVEFVGRSGSVAYSKKQFERKQDNEIRKKSRENTWGVVGRSCVRLADATLRSNIGAGNQRENGRREHSDGDFDFSRYAPARNDHGAWAIIAEVDATRMPAIESSLRGVVDGLAGWDHKLRAIGNGVDSLVAAYAFVTLWAAIQGES